MRVVRCCACSGVIQVDAHVSVRRQDEPPIREEHFAACSLPGPPGTSPPGHVNVLYQWAEYDACEALDA